MGILTMLGLMRVEDHKAETNRLNLELAKQGNALSEAKAEARKATADRDKFRDQVRDTAARAEKAERNLRVADNQTKAAIASRDEWKGAALRNRADAEKFRAKAARDAEQKRAERAAAKKGAG